MHYNKNTRKWLPSDHNVMCDICGRKRKRSEVTNAYGTGDIPVVISCLDGCADTRHPLNSPPPIIFDGLPVVDPRPEGTDVFVSYNFGTFRWGTFNPSAVWGSFHMPNNSFNIDGIWLWGSIAGNSNSILL